MLNEEAEEDDIRMDFSKMMNGAYHVLQTIYVKRDKDTFLDTPLVQDEVFAIIKQARAEKEKK